MGFVYEHIDTICKIGIALGAVVIVISIVMGIIVAANGGNFITGARMISMLGGVAILGLSIFGLIKSNS